jgi:hypothetical protein
MISIDGFRKIRTGGYGALAAVVALVVFGAGAPAFAGSITIVPTFDSTITSLSDASDVEAAINGAIGEVEGAIASPNNITVAIDFQSMNSGLGESSTWIYTIPYYTYYNALAGVATSPLQITALDSLGPAPSGPSSGNPVNGNSDVNITSAEGRNLGLNTPAGSSYDSTIGLNTSITYPPQPNNGSNYGLEAVANHEIDEALGIGGTGSTLEGTGGSLTGPVGDLDLYRYSAPGVRSYSNTNTTSPYSYFSIDGGNTVLSYFNQTDGSDFGDWLSNPIPAGFEPQVQDAFGEPGTDPLLGTNEVTAFAAIGYEVVAPEPSSLLLFASALAIVAIVRRRRIGLRKSQSL